MTADLGKHWKLYFYICSQTLVMKQLSGLFVLMIFLAACNNSGTDKPADPVLNPPPPTINYSVLNVFPHDTASFIQGLEFYNGELLESTGSPAEYAYPSWLGRVDLKTGKLKDVVSLDPKYFAEGITVMNDKLYQLTWQNKKGFVYDAKTLRKLGEFDYNMEGWGLTHDSSLLILSDGSSNIHFIDPATFRTQRIQGVTDQNGPVSNLNELEYIDGFIYANQWMTSYILKIDPASGKVVGRLDLSSLVAETGNKYAGRDYLNGIAYNPASKTVYVTGKRWPSMYEIKF
jgi:glutaminyl-peptide cyclotransferase